MYSLNYIVIGNFLVMNLLPVVTLAVLNYFIYNTVTRSTRIHNSISKSHKRDTTMAALLFSIVIVFLCCHTTRLTLNVYEPIQMVCALNIPDLRANLVTSTQPLHHGSPAPLVTVQPVQNTSFHHNDIFNNIEEFCSQPPSPQSMPHPPKMVL